jgi:hypothetical protein
VLSEGEPLRRPEAPPLGQLLVQRGLLSAAQLAVVLEEQRRTGRRLGELIVALRFAPPTAVAQALASQHGGFLRSEYGVAFGFETGAGGGPLREPPLTTPTKKTTLAPQSTAPEAATLVDQFGLRLAPTTPHPASRTSPACEKVAAAQRLHDAKAKRTRKPVCTTWDEQPDPRIEHGPAAR